MTDHAKTFTELLTAAKEQAVSRYPSGWAGAAAVRLSNGEIVTSVAPDVKNDALSLCMEVGGMLEAHRRDLAVTHSLCIARNDVDSEFKVLSPCGVCQERLMHWELEANEAPIQVAISNLTNQLEFLPLAKLQPHHWSLAYK